MNLKWVGVDDPIRSEHLLFPRRLTSRSESAAEPAEGLAKIVRTGTDLSPGP